MATKKTQTAVATVATNQTAMAITDTTAARCTMQGQAVDVVVADLKAGLNEKQHQLRQQYAAATAAHAEAMGAFSKATEQGVVVVDDGVYQASSLVCQVGAPLGTIVVDVAYNASAHSITGEVTVQRTVSIGFAEDHRETTSRVTTTLNEVPKYLVDLGKAVGDTYKVAADIAKELAKVQAALVRLPDAREQLMAKAMRSALTADTDGAKLLDTLAASVRQALPIELRDILS